MSQEDIRLKKQNMVYTIYTVRYYFIKKKKGYKHRLKKKNTEKLSLK